LAVQGRGDPKRGRRLRRNVLDRYEVDAAGLWAVDREVVDLISVIAAVCLRISVVSVGAARGEDHGAVTESSRFALNADKTRLEINHEVIPRVLSERQEEIEARIVQSQHDCESRPVADPFRVFHVASLANASAGPWPEEPSRVAYDDVRAGVAQLVRAPLL
jgi:hypothetical protein